MGNLTSIWGAQQEALLHKPVNDTSTNDRVIGGNSAGIAVVVDDKDDNMTNTRTNLVVGQQQQHTQQSPTEQEARRAFLATQEVKMEAVCCHCEQTIKAKRRADRHQQDYCITTTTDGAPEQ